MSSCSCDEPTEYRATSESTSGSYLYLRCEHCGGKVGRVSVDYRDLRENVTNPDDAEERVSIHLDPGDNSFTTDDEPTSDTDTQILESYGERNIQDQGYWVYVLDCRNRWYYDDFNDLKRRAQARLDREPDWLRMAWEAKRRKYVGQTENILKRLGEHFDDRKRTEFTTLFEPSRIDYLQPAGTRKAAERDEKRIGKSYYDNDDVYAYWN